MLALRSLALSYELWMLVAFSFFGACLRSTRSDAEGLRRTGLASSVKLTVRKMLAAGSRVKMKGEAYCARSPPDRTR